MGDERGWGLEVTLGEWSMVFRKEMVTQLNDLFKLIYLRSGEM